MTTPHQPILGSQVRALTTVAAVAALVLTGGLTANADDGQPGADAVARLVAEAAPAAADVVTPVENSGGNLISTTATGAEVLVPTDSEDYVELSADASNGRSVSVAMKLPAEVSAGDAVVARDGTVVYPGDDTSDVAVQATVDGVRIQTILRDGSAPTEFTYGIEEVVPELNADGSVTLTTRADEDGVSLVVGEIAAPWAVDAKGMAVPTRYRLDSGNLVQEVDHQPGHYAYPIVADPSVSFGRYIYVRYSKAEVKRAAPYVWTNRFQALFCLVIPNTVVAGACLIAVDQWATSIANSVVDADNRNRCFEMRFTIIGAAPVGWNSYAC